MTKIEAVAKAMKAKRDELIAQPLARIWPELAMSAVAAAETFDANTLRASCKHSRASGNGWTNGLGDGHFEWSCPDCGAVSSSTLHNS